MAANVPARQITLMAEVYRKVFPAVNKELDYWTHRAQQIPDQELRNQALASIQTKRFHCQGGAVFALLAGERWKEAVRFIVAYQTISDYLDNLCDRSTSLDPEDFRLLHESMKDALSPGNKRQNYYALRKEQKDGKYLKDLVNVCQQVLTKIKGNSIMQNYIWKLESLYADLQVHKHVRTEERIPRLTAWHKKHKQLAQGLTWYEFSAATGSTLGVFCLVSYTLGGWMREELADYIFKGYFPYIQGLHILLDYYIDQNEDRVEGDLNFCSYYPDHITMARRFHYFIECGEEQVMTLPHPKFHEMVIHGLVGLYLGDQKVKNLTGGEKMTSLLLKSSGMDARFFHWNTKMYYALEKRKQANF